MAHRTTLDAIEGREFVIDRVTVVDPVAGRVFDGHVGVRDGRIDFVREGPAPADIDRPCVDGEGLHLAPGLVDIHVHLREPGQEHKETIATGTRAAAAGGFTTVACMPNTDPAIDERSVVEFVRRQADIAGFARVLPIAAATRGRRGEAIAEYFELRDAGAVAVSDDGAPVASAGILRRVLEYAAAAGLPLIEHCEDPSATGDGFVREGFHATRLGMKGVPAWSETLGLVRDLVVLGGVPGARLHAAHLSARASLESIRIAKDRGLAVTAETAPHYLVFTDADLETFDTNLRINPPIGDEADREALVEALRDGTLDCIASDHAPHAPQEKDVEFDRAPPGTVGLETTLAVVLTHLVAPGHLDLARAVALLSCEPARCIGVEAGTLREGAPADLVLFDPDAEWIVTPESLHSKSKNSAFLGRTLRGRVRATLLAGRLVWRAAAASATGDGRAAGAGGG